MRGHWPDCSSLPRLGMFCRAAVDRGRAGVAVRSRAAPVQDGAGGGPQLAGPAQPGEGGCWGGTAVGGAGPGEPQQAAPPSRHQHLGSAEHPQQRRLYRGEAGQRGPSNQVAQGVFHLSPPRGRGGNIVCSPVRIDRSAGRLSLPAS